MAAQTSPLSLEEFHARFDGAKPAYEYWDGVAIQKPMPTLLHSILEVILTMFLDKAGWNAVPEVRLKVVPDAEPVPDMIAVRGKKYKGRYPKVAPELCIEILSPGDTLSKTLSKAKRYISWGSEYVWVIDPEKRTAWILSQDRPEPVWISPEGSLRAGDTEISLSSLFAEVEKKMDLTDSSD
ncbi:MAG: Uma2 family endonuclease [Bryobacteraceae bacterium]